METLGKIALWIGGILLAIFCGFFLIAFVAFLVSSIHGSATHRYWIDAADTTYYTNSYEEKDGCLLFTDHLNHQVKHCGLYSISDKGVR